MTTSRREVLAAGALATSVVAMGGCEKILSKATARLGQSVPDAIASPSGAEIDPAHHLLSRAGYGPWPGDVEKARALGEDAWIEQQLDPKSIDDTACDLRAGRFEELEQAPGECYEYRKPVLREDMSRQTLLRAVYSKRQLFEVMASFWTDHFNINIEKGDCIYLKPADDRNVIRAHAMGKFRDLVRASATSAAMLVYLDGNQNARAKPEDLPNENYGRELLELHTLGVRGGYTQQDVFEAARALTGWRVRHGFRKGTVYFDPKLHDDAAKRLLGQVIPAGGGEADVDRVVNIVCRHAATAHHIATKLVRRFVSDDPPPALVAQTAEVFRKTDGDIKAILRTVLRSEEFRAARGGKFKPPFRFVASALRAVAADTHAHSPLIDYLVRMGQGVFQYPTPDGYPDKASPWLGTLLWRWNFALALAGGRVPSVSVPLAELVKALGDDGGERHLRLFSYFAGRSPSPEHAAALAAVHANDEAVPRELVGLILASPGFQRY